MNNRVLGSKPLVSYLNNLFAHQNPSYGEQGCSIILDSLQHMFPLPTMLSQHISPLQPREFMTHVLLKEAAKLLICEDLSVTGEEGATILQDSWKYGVLMYPN